LATGRASRWGHRRGEGPLGSAAGLPTVHPVTLPLGLRVGCTPWRGTTFSRPCSPLCDGCDLGGRGVGTLLDGDGPGMWWSQEENGPRMRMLPGWRCSQDEDGLRMRLPPGWGCSWDEDAPRMEMLPG